MRIPTIRGLIDRRVLVNYRVDPDVLSRVCPAPFRPQTVNGFGMAGLCLIRLKHIRPKRWPSFLGISSENAAHRIAVEWEIDGVRRTGVYIPRRDTSSMLNAVAGGRVFPGVHHRARFMVRETDEEYRIAMDSVDGTAHVAVEGRTADELPASSVFANVAKCSQFFEAGSLGYSPASEATQFDGLELRTANWHVQPLAVTSVRSSFFDDRDVFPEGSVSFDNALLMRGVDHEWHHRESLCNHVLSNDPD
ncbi:MAG TPA: hypothetical protein DDX19_13190 [Rhodopirellula baltica]|uniref:Uncharacterized protein n=2 Tax=Rhodopirellula baltica TaxID=265606 RepID=Q7UQR1_RHOBA|nr:DUF2071 domain-containing protein [Rhodopirellula baltica]CAD74636.1 hypothetical protein RB6151 [Rhodopirellula baltica SH 1]HBE63665.1 hypothetical protein [Rhodopirellula baltica]